MSEGNEQYTKLRRVLKERSITQAELAEVCNMETAQLSKIVLGKVTDTIRLETAKKICMALNMTLDELWWEDRHSD